MLISQGTGSRSGEIGVDMVHQRPIVVGVDGSTGSDLAVRWAADAASVRQLPLRVVHVVERLRAVRPSISTAIMSAFDWTAWGTEITHEAARLAQGATSALKVETELLVEGPAAEVLVHEAAVAELLVLGANHQGRVAGAFLGSTAVNVLEQAAGRVVVVRERGQAEDSTQFDRVVVGVDGSDSSDS